MYTLLRLCWGGLVIHCSIFERKRGTGCRTRQVVSQQFVQATMSIIECFISMYIYCTLCHCTLQAVLIAEAVQRIRNDSRGALKAADGAAGRGAAAGTAYQHLNLQICNLV